MIELLVVMAIIAVLAGLLLPSLSRAKFQAKNVICKSNLRQLGLGLQMYATTYGAYPPKQTFSDSTGTAAYLWDQLLERFIYPNREVLPYGYFTGPRKYDRMFLCPFFVSKHRHMPWETRPLGPVYGYNTFGVGFDGGMDRPLLGLSGLGLPHERPTVPESAVVAPSEMIAFGDPFARAQVRAFDGVYLDEYSWRPIRIKPTPSSSDPEVRAKSPAAARIHRNRFNKVFCDGHVEMEDFNKPFVASDEYLRRWNNDHEPHRKLWEW